jgi:hypothetical protein
VAYSRLGGEIVWSVKVRKWQDVAPGYFLPSIVTEKRRLGSKSAGEEVIYALYTSSIQWERGGEVVNGRAIAKHLRSVGKISGPSRLEISLNYYDKIVSRMAREIGAPHGEAFVRKPADALKESTEATLDVSYGGDDWLSIDEYNKKYNEGPRFSYEDLMSRYCSQAALACYLRAIGKNVGICDVLAQNDAGTMSIREVLDEACEHGCELEAVRINAVDLKNIFGAYILVQVEGSGRPGHMMVAKQMEDGNVRGWIPPSLRMELSDISKSGIGDYDLIALLDRDQVEGMSRPDEKIILIVMLSLSMVLLVMLIGRRLRAKRAAAVVKIIVLLSLLSQGCSGEGHEYTFVDILKAPESVTVNELSLGEIGEVNFRVKNVLKKSITLEVTGGSKCSMYSLPRTKYEVGGGEEKTISVRIVGKVAGRATGRLALKIKEYNLIKEVRLYIDVPDLIRCNPERIALVFSGVEVLDFAEVTCSGVEDVEDYKLHADCSLPQITIVPMLITEAERNKKRYSLSAYVNHGQPAYRGPAQIYMYMQKNGERVGLKEVSANVAIEIQ